MTALPVSSQLVSMPKTEEPKLFKLNFNKISCKLTERLVGEVSPEKLYIAQTLSNVAQHQHFNCFLIMQVVFMKWSFIDDKPEILELKTAYTFYLRLSAALQRISHELKIRNSPLVWFKFFKALIKLENDCDRILITFHFVTFH